MRRVYASVPALARRGRSAVAGVRGVLGVLALAAVLGGCTSTSGTARSSDPASQSPGSSGVTVFGDIDVGVTRERSR